MLDERFVAILRCPKTQNPLKVLGTEELEKLNLKRQESQLEHVEAALINEVDSLIYPIVNGIPVLLVDEAVQV